MTDLARCNFARREKNKMPEHARGTVPGPVRSCLHGRHLSAVSFALSFSFSYSVRGVSPRDLQTASESTDAENRDRRARSTRYGVPQCPPSRKECFSLLFSHSVTEGKAAGAKRARTCERGSKHRKYDRATVSRVTRARIFINTPAPRRSATLQRPRSSLLSYPLCRPQSRRRRGRKE